MSIAMILGQTALGAAGLYGTYKASQQAGAALTPHANNSLGIAIDAVKRAWVGGVGQNYVTASKGVRVEPHVLVDARVLRLAYAKDVMNCAQRLFISYYTLAVSADNTINGVKVSRRLDKYAPDRDLADASIRFLSNESYHFGLPFVGEAAGLQRFDGFSPESRPVATHSFEANEDGGSKTSGTVSNRAPVDVQSLAMGQIVDVNFSDGAHTGTVQVMVRMKPIGMDSDLIVDIMSVGGPQNSHADRKMRVKVGDLEMMGDLIMNKDRLRQYRKTLMKDKSGYFRQVHARQNRSWIATLLTGQPNIAQATSIAIISRDTAREIEDRISSKLSDFGTRQKLFEDSLLMLLFVVDDDTETVTIFTQDTEHAGVYTLDEIKAPSKGGSNDLTDIMRAFLEGKVPGRL